MTMLLLPDVTSTRPERRSHVRLEARLVAEALRHVLEPAHERHTAIRRLVALADGNRTAVQRALALLHRDADRHADVLDAASSLLREVLATGSWAW